MNIKKFLLKITGIADLLQRIKNLEIQKDRLQIFCDQLNKRREETDSYIGYIRDENSLILDHIKFLNEGFRVGVDIDSRDKRMSGKLIILYMGNGRHLPEVKEFDFNDEELPHLTRILAGFGKENVSIDAPRNFYPRIDFKY